MTNKAFIFLHVPKAAGTTLNEIIREILPRDQIFNLYHHVVNLNAYDRLSDEQKKAIRFFVGHVHFGIHQRLGLTDYQYFTMLRDPIERVISDYHFGKNQYGHIWYQAINRENLSIIDAHRPGIIPDNQMVRIIGNVNVPNGTLNRNHLESAKENLKNHCLFGLSTQFDEFLFRLSRLMGLEINGYIKKNITYKKKQRQEHDPQLIKKIAELNALDVEFYQYAENLYQQQMARRSAGELADCTVFIEKMCSMNQISVEYHEANKYYDNQQWPEAKKRFKELIDRYNNIPQSLKAEICFKLGNCSKEMGTADADTWFAQCMDLYLPHLGSGPLTDYRVGSVHKRLKEFNTAARYFSNVVNHPDMTDILAKGGAYFHLGDIAMRQTNHKQAIEYFKKALELNPDHLKAAQYIQDLTEKQ